MAAAGEGERRESSGEGGTKVGMLVRPPGVTRGNGLPGLGGDRGLPGSSVLGGSGDADGGSVELYFVASAWRANAVASFASSSKYGLSRAVRAADSMARCHRSVRIEEEGARVEGQLGDLKIHRQATRHYSYCVSNSPLLHIGLGGEPALRSIRVHWPNGKTSEHGDVSAGSRIQIIQP